MKLFVFVLIILLTNQVFSQSNCSLCKQDLLNNLKVNFESPIIKCLQSNTENDKILSSMLTNCLLTAGYSSSRVAQLVNCAMMNCLNDVTLSNNNNKN